MQENNYKATKVQADTSIPAAALLQENNFRATKCRRTPSIPAAALLQENNFKAVLECIRDLMNEQTVVPDWLHDVFLGYGDPAQAQYGNMPQDQLLQTVDFKVRPWVRSILGLTLLVG